MDTNHTIGHESTGTTARPLPHVTQIIKGACAIYQKRFKNLLSIGLIAGAGISLPEIISGWMATDNGSVAGGFVLTVIAIVITLWSVLAILITIKNHEIEISVKDAYAQAGPLLSSYFWVSLLSGLIVTVGFMLFVIPGIIFMVWFSLVVYVFLIEGTRGIDALRKSREYVRDNWSAFFLYQLILILTGIALSIVLAILTLQFSNDVATLLSSVLSAAFIPLFLAYMYLVYKAARDHKPLIALVENKKESTLFAGLALLGALAVVVFVFASPYFESRLSSLGLFDPRSHTALTDTSTNPSVIRVRDLSLELPEGWVKQDAPADNATRAANDNSSLTILAILLPEGIRGQIDSVDSLVTMGQFRQGIQDTTPGVVFENVELVELDDVDSQKAVFTNIDQTTQTSLVSHQYLVLHDDTLYTISFVSPENQRVEQENQFDEIIRSIRLR